MIVFALTAIVAPGTPAADGTVLKKYFVNSGLPNNWIKGIFRDGPNVVVAAGDDARGGTVVYDREKDAFVPFSPGAGFVGRKVTGWAEYGGKGYVGTESALNVRDGKKWTSLKNFNQVNHSQEALFSDGKELFAVARVMYGGVLRYNGKDWSIVDRGAGTGIMNNATRLVRRGDDLFIGTTTNGLYHFDGKAWHDLGPADGLPGVWVTSLAVTDEGVWIGCYNGLGLFDGGKIKKFGVEDGLPSNKVSVLQVVKGKLLVGTMDRGLAIRSRRGFDAVTQGLSDIRIEAIGEADEGAWVGTVNGLNLIELR